MEQKNVSYFWKILDRFNFLMKESIEGPNCTNSEICRGDCCSIKIDVPKVLAHWYIDNGYAEETDFIRSNIFSFHLRFDLNTGKCFLFDKHKNGCIVHNSGRKPPQCWIYPTGFFNSSNDTISCKKVGGWKIKNLEYTKEAEKLLKKYVILCHGEALEEQTKIKERLKYSISMEKQKNNKSLPSSLKRISPSKLGGFKDSWNSIKYLSAEGYSLQMKKFCERFNNDCEFLKTNFLDCEHICDKIITKLIDYLNYYILDYIRNKGTDPEGEYPLFKLFNYISI